MEYQPSAVSVVCIVCSDQPAARYPSPIPVRVSHKLENQPVASTPSSSSAREDHADSDEPCQNLDQPRPRDGSPNGSHEAVAAVAARPLSPLSPSAHFAPNARRRRHLSPTGMPTRRGERCAHPWRRLAGWPSYIGAALRLRVVLLGLVGVLAARAISSDGADAKPVAG